MEDIEIARKAKLENITKIATKLGIDEEYIEQYGKYKAKISCKLYEKGRKAISHSQKFPATADRP